jgi:DNA-directed RNA polymerase specialized sigma24 family protein
MAWLCKILENEIGIHRRYQTAQKRDLRRDQPLESAHAQEWLQYLSLRSRSDEGATLSRQEEIERVRLALDKLPDHYRLVLTWRDVDGLEFTEMGAKLDRGADATRMLYERAKKKLTIELRKLSEGV